MASTVLPNGIIIPEKYSRDWYADLYHNWQELDNLLGGGTPKDGTLTIQKNGDTVGTFSANQSTNETIDIAVPTKTSDLTNDSNFVQSSDLATVATSGSYNDLSNKPTIPTVNNATLTIQKNGTNVQTFTANQSTNATANITVPTKTSDLTNDSGFITSDNTKIPLTGSNQISGDLIPSTDNSIDIGSSSKKIKSVFANYLNSIDLSALYVIMNAGYIADLNDSSLRVEGKVVVCSYDRATLNSPTPQASGTCFTLANLDSSDYGIQVALSNNGIYTRFINNGDYAAWTTIVS